MNYKTLGRTGMQVSEIGLGCEHLMGQDEDAVAAVVNAAIENNINIFDVFMSDPKVRTNLGKALVGKRDKVMLQGHIGAAWIKGQYCRTRDLEECKFFFEDFLKRLQTDYVDIGMIHYVDTAQDYTRVFDTDVIKYALELKEKGVIKAIGMSSHDPATALKAVKTGLIDVLMFSINPAYDLLPEEIGIDTIFATQGYKDHWLDQVNPVREELYQTCEAMGTGITIMKSLGAGALLNEKTSPFGVALSNLQCFHYALTRPAAASVLVGCRTPEEVVQAVAYESASDQQKDYSMVLSTIPKFSLKEKCMYCNHCLPCPKKIDVAQVNKFLDLALLSDSVPESVKEHYLSLEHTAGECIACRSCERNCPFDVHIVDRMRKAQEVFGK